MFKFLLIQLIATIGLIDISCASIINSARHPNVIIMHINNLLWSDLGIHVNRKDSENSTPNIDYLAYSGVILNRFYANGGLNSLHSGCHNRSQYGNPNLLKTYFERNGYKINFIANENYDKIEDFEEGVLDAITNDNEPFLTVVDFGNLGTDIKIPFVDEIVGSTVTKANQLGVLNDTIFLFLSLPDSDSPLERNIRRAAFIYSPLLKLQQRVSNQMIHIIDLLPTLVNASNLQWRTRDRIFIDGVNQWQALNENAEHRLSIYGDNFFINNNWKLSFGVDDGGDSYGSIENEIMESDKDMTDLSDLNTYVNSILASEIYLLLNKIPSERILLLRNRAMVHCNLRDIDELAVKNIKCSTSSPCLFDLFEDPCEFDNKYEEEFEAKRVQMQATFHQFLIGESTDDVGVKSTSPNGEESSNDGTITGVILGATVVGCILIFIVVVCVKERCNNKRSVYYDKSEEASSKKKNESSRAATPETSNGIAVVSSSKLYI